MPTRGGIELQIDSAEFKRSMNQLRSFDRKLYLQVRRKLREAGRSAVQDVRREVRKGGPSRTGLREALAEGTQVSVLSGRRAGVTITTSPTRLPANKKSMAKAWNRSTFRHPLPGDREHWVTQAGHPYFGATLAHHRAAMQQAILQALQDAIRQMEGTT